MVGHVLFHVSGMLIGLRYQLVEKLVHGQAVQKSF
jgi:hypothetical protein